VLTASRLLVPYPIIALASSAASGAAGDAPHTGGRRTRLRRPRRKALDNGLLIDAAPAARPPHAVPQYQEIIDGAWYVRLFAGLVQALGIISAITGILGAVVLVINAKRDGGDFGAETRAAVTVLWIGALSAGAYLAAGAVLKMLAAVAEAVGDMARNSFRR
jgi:hypothetical protein